MMNGNNENSVETIYSALRDLTTLLNQFPPNHRGFAGALQKELRDVLLDLMLWMSYQNEDLRQPLKIRIFGQIDLLIKLVSEEILPLYRHKKSNELLLAILNKLLFIKEILTNTVV